jgi:syntaxin-binding protein 1
MGPAAAPTGGETKSVAKSVRKYGVNSRWGKKDQNQLSGGRFMVFIAGGVSYAELRSAYESMMHNTKEVIVGSSHIVNPEGYLENIAEFAGSL